MLPTSPRNRSDGDNVQREAQSSSIPAHRHKAHTDAHTYTDTHSYTCIHTHTQHNTTQHARTHPRTHARTHAHTHTHTYSHLLLGFRLQCSSTSSMTKEANTSRPKERRPDSQERRRKLSENDEEDWAQDGSQTAVGSAPAA